jgi:hypothetical protein
MKNYLKFVVAVFGITVASFGSISTASAKKSLNDDNVTCESTGNCGYTAYPECKVIVGTAKASQ